jgi:dihydrofolate reductase
MGRTTFEPALGAPRWPWPKLDVFVLGRTCRPARTPAGRDRQRPGQAAREDPRGQPRRLRPPRRRTRTIATFCGLAAVARLELVILPLFLGDGMRLTPPRALDTALTLESERPLPGGSVELVYAVGR